MFDIHCHALPLIDDGSIHMEMTLNMLRHAQTEGILGVVMTPHSGLPTSATVTETRLRFEECKQVAKQAGIFLDMYLGSEIFCSKSIIPSIHEKSMISINQTRYVLVEFDTQKYLDQYDNILHEIIIAGYIPIIAHIERYAFIRDNHNMVYDLIEKGCLMQINQDSIMGRSGVAIQKLSHLLLSHHLVHFVASDAHDLRSRPIHLKSGHKEIIKRYGIEYAYDLFGRNPLNVIQNQIVIKRRPYRIPKHNEILFKYNVFATTVSRF